jgi:hypothetical protein
MKNFVILRLGTAGAKNLQINSPFSYDRQANFELLECRKIIPPPQGFSLLISSNSAMKQAAEVVPVFFVRNSSRKLSAPLQTVWIMPA